MRQGVRGLPEQQVRRGVQRQEEEQRLEIDRGRAVARDPRQQGLDVRCQPLQRLLDPAAVEGRLHELPRLSPAGAVRAEDARADGVLHVGHADRGEREVGAHVDLFDDQRVGGDVGWGGQLSNIDLILISS